MFCLLIAHFLRKTHSIMTGIVILSASEGSRRHPRGCEILPPCGRQNDKRVKDNPSLVTNVKDLVHIHVGASEMLHFVQHDK